MSRHIYDWLTDTLAGLCVVMFMGAFLVALVVFS